LKNRADIEMATRELSSQPGPAGSLLPPEPAGSTG
jgi:hypothetical protein